MISEEDVARSSVIREEHKLSLIAELKKYPDFSWLLGSPNQHHTILQGDLLSLFPTVYMKPKGDVVSKRQLVMVVNNTCDLQQGRQNFVTVAPVFDAAKFFETKRKEYALQAWNDCVRSIKTNQANRLFYVPGIQGYADGGIVRLDMMCTVASQILDEAVKTGTRIGSFTQTGFYVLLLKLTHYLTRTESAEVAR